MDLKLDGHCQRASLLDDAQWIRGFIATLAETIGMTIVNGPTVHVFKGPSPEGRADNGLSAIAIIAESHICIHTWPKVKYVQVDVSSCRPFCVEDARKFIRGYLLIDDVTYYLVDISRPGPPLTAEIKMAA